MKTLLRESTFGRSRPPLLREFQRRFLTNTYCQALSKYVKFQENAILVIYCKVVDSPMHPSVHAPVCGLGSIEA